MEKVNRFSKTMALLIGSLLMVLNSCHQGTESKKAGYELKAPPPPFKKAAAGKAPSQSIEKPIFSGRVIKCGSKELAVAPCGEISFISDGLKLFKLYANVNTKFSSWMPNQRRSPVPRQAKNGQLGITESKVDNKNQSFTIKGFAPLLKNDSNDGPKANFEQQVALRKDGKIAIDYTLKIANKDKDSFNRFALLMELSYPVFSESSVRIDQQDKPAKNFATAAPASMTLAPGNSFAEFGLEACFKGAVRRVIPKSLRSVVFGFYPAKSSAKNNEPQVYKLNLILDPMTGNVVSKKTENYGGVDFNKIDDLNVPNYAICRNLIQNPSFECGRMFLTQHFRRQYYAVDLGHQIDPKEAKFGKYSLKLCSSQIKPRHFVFMTAPAPVTPGKYTLSYYIKCSDPAKSKIQSVNIRTSGYQKLGRKYVRPTKEWKRHSVTFEVKNPAAALAGFGCAIEDFGNVWIDGIQLERGDKATDFVSKPLGGLLKTSHKRNFLKTGDKIDARLSLISDKPETKGSASIQVKDFFGKTRHYQNLSFNTGKDGVIELPLDFENKFTRGIYMVEAKYSLESGEGFSEFFRFSIMDPMKGEHKNRQMFCNSYSSHFPHNVHPGLETYLKRCRDLGVGSMNSVGYPSKEYTDLLEKYGIAATNSNMINSLPVKDKKKNPKERFRIYSKPYYNKDSKLLLRDFNTQGNGTIDKAYIEKLNKAITEKVELYPGVEYYGFIGESIAKWPDWYRNDLKSFIDVRVAAFKAMKKLGKKITNAASCNMEPMDGVKKIEIQLKSYAGKIKFDALNCHTYLPAGPYALENNIKIFLNMIAKYGYKDTPVFFPEGMHYGPYEVPLWGVVSAVWSPPRTWYGGTLSYDMGWTEKKTAAWFARSWLTCMKYTPQIFSACSGAQNMISNFQLDFDMTPRAYQKIPNTLSRLLGNADFVKDVSFAPKSKCLIFKDDEDRPVVAIWGQNQKVDFGYENGPSATVDFTGLEPEAFDLMESKRDVIKDASGKAKVPVSAFPFFFRGESGETEKYCEIFANAQISGAEALPLSLSAKAASPESIDLAVRNLISRQVKGSMTVSGKTQKIDIKPGAEEHFIAKLPHPLQANKIIEENVPVVLEEDGNSEKLNSTISFPGFLCRKTNAKITIDGSLDDWKNIPAIPVKNRNHSRRFGNKTYPENDFKGKFRVAWDKDHLYVAVEITDNMFYHQEKQGKGAGSRWNNDSLQIYMDTFCDARQKGKVGYDANDYDFAVFPNAAGDSARVFRYRSVDRQLAMGVEVFKENVFEPGIIADFKKTDKGYVYEVAFPAKYILPVKLEKNYSIGFGMYINDRDEEKHVKQALTLTPPGTGCYRRPYLYPIMLLSE